MTVRTVPVVMFSKQKGGRRMPRKQRIISESGYYHVVIRGVGRQMLFEEDRDYETFLRILGKYCKEINVTVLAYCLMSNHVHMLVCDCGNNISLCMKKIGVSYSKYFNEKYERSGHLFQDRFFSDPIRSENQLLKVFAYILNNPVKAGICRASEYKWSSFHEYWGKGSFVDASVAESLFGCEECFRDILDDQTIADDGSVSKKLFSDEWAVDVMRECIGTGKGVELQKYSRKDRDEALHKLKKYGLSVRQIERLTGINRGIVQRA
jgi:REP element-mobilizing transposase RayT